MARCIKVRKMTCISILRRQNGVCKGWLYMETFSFFCYFKRKVFKAHSYKMARIYGSYEKHISIIPSKIQNGLIMFRNEKYEDHNSPILIILRIRSMCLRHNKYFFKQKTLPCWIGKSSLKKARYCQI